MVPGRESDLLMPNERPLKGRVLELRGTSRPRQTQTPATTENMPGKNPLPTDRRKRDAAPSEPRENPPMESDTTASPLFGITRWEENLSTACFSATRGAGASAASRHDPLVACLTADTGRDIGLRQTAPRSRLPSVAAAHAGALLPAAAANSAARIRCCGPAQRPHATPYLPHSFCWMEELEAQERILRSLVGPPAGAFQNLRHPAGCPCLASVCDKT